MDRLDIRLELDKSLDRYKIDLSEEILRKKEVRNQKSEIRKIWTHAQKMVWNLETSSNIIDQKFR